MKGHIRPRGPGAWELKFDVPSENGERKTRYVSFHGGKREAQKKLTELLDQVNKGSFVDPSKLRLADFLERWESWAATQVSAKTLERYKELLKHHVRPHLGGRPVQKLRTVDFADLYGKLQSPKPDGAGLAPRTVGHVHRLMHRVMGHAVKWSIVGSNPVTAAEPPRVQRTEIEVLAPDQFRAVLDALRGRPLYPVAVIGLATGMRRGEIAALRWADIDLDAGKVRVERSLSKPMPGWRSSRRRPRPAGAPSRFRPRSSPSYASIGASSRSSALRLASARPAPTTWPSPGRTAARGRPTA